MLPEPEVRRDYARWLLNGGRLAEAEAELQRLPAQLVGVAAGLATIRLREGRAAEGIALLEPVLDQADRDPNIAFTWARLCASAGRLPEALPVLDRAISAFPAPDAQAPLRMARGRALDAMGAPGAFAEWQQAHRLEGLRFDPAAHRDRVRRICEQFPVSAKDHLPRAPVERGDPTPVFIVGMPRSGTSLTEQILACHPSVCAMGELEEIRRAVAQISAAQDDPAQDDPAQLLALRRRWQAAIPAAGARVQTDKMPINFLHLGWIAQMFPDARIIHCRRDPMDVALSCFQTEFSPAYAWSRRLEWIALFEMCHRLLMKHWQQAIPLPILALDYERLVQEPEAQIRRVLEFCGLPWHAGCLHPHLNQRYMATASFDQVRHPISATSIGRWRRYSAELEPLRQIYARAGLC